MSRYRQSLMCSSSYTYSSYCYAQTKNESGRSMVEMLVVLAVIGVLSVAGVAGFKTAMNKYRANELLSEASKRSLIVLAELMMGSAIDEISFDEENNTIGNATFATSASAIPGNNKFAISVSGVNKPICQNLVNLGEVQIAKQADLTSPITASQCEDLNAIAFIYEADDYVAESDAPFEGSTCSCKDGWCSIVNGTSVVSECGAGDSCINNGQSLYCDVAGFCSTERYGSSYVSYANNYEGANWASTKCDRGCSVSDGYATCNTSPYCNGRNAYNWDVDQNKFTSMTCNYSRCITDGASAYCDTNNYCSDAGYSRAACNWLEASGIYYCQTCSGASAGCVLDNGVARCDTVGYCRFYYHTGYGIGYSACNIVGDSSYTCVSCGFTASLCVVEDGIASCKRTPYCAQDNTYPYYPGYAYNWDEGNGKWDTINCGRDNCTADNNSAYCSNTTPSCIGATAYNWNGTQFTSLYCGLPDKCQTDGVSAYCDTTPYCQNYGGWGYAYNWDGTRFTAKYCTYGCITDGVSAYCGTPPYCRNYTTYGLAYNWDANRNTYTSMSCKGGCTTDGVSAYCGGTMPYCSGPYAYNWDADRNTYTTMRCRGRCTTDGVSAYCDTMPYCSGPYAYIWDTNQNRYTGVYCSGGCSIDGGRAYCHDFCSGPYAYIWDTNRNRLIAARCKGGCFTSSEGARCGGYCSGELAYNWDTNQNAYTAINCSPSLCAIHSGSAYCDAAQICDTVPFCTKGVYDNWKAYQWDANQNKFTSVDCGTKSCSTNDFSAWCE